MLDVKDLLLIVSSTTDAHQASTTITSLIPVLPNVMMATTKMLQVSVNPAVKDAASVMEPDWINVQPAISIPILPIITR